MHLFISLVAFDNKILSTSCYDNEDHKTWFCPS